MKLTKNQNHGLEGLNDYTDFSSVKSNNPCHQENPKNQGSDNMKQGWEIKRLEDVVEFQRGLTYSKKDEVDFSDNIVLRSNNVDLFRNQLDFQN